MLKQILGFFGSTSVAILLTAAGLVFKADQLTYFGGGLLAVVASGWLLLRLNPRPDPERARVIWSERKDLIASARTAVARHTRKEAGDTQFREFFVGLPIYAQLRRHLSASYLKDFDNLRMVAVSNNAMDAFAAGLLEELDRLESEWGLDRA